MKAELQEKFEYIDHIDFEKLLVRLTQEEKCSAIDPLMDVELARMLIHKYKCFLKLKLLKPDLRLLPSFGIDVIWHYHILDTRRYVENCHYLFGEYLHHTPDYSLVGFDEELATPIQEMDSLYREHFDLSIHTDHQGQIF